MQPRIDLFEELSAALKEKAALLRERSAFAQFQWFVPRDEDDPGHPGECGTRACAYGIASTLPGWKAAGFGLIDQAASDGEWIDRNRFHPGIDGRAAKYDDVASRLGVSYDEFAHIFGVAYRNNTDPLEVAGRIDRFVEELKAQEAQAVSA